MERYRRQVLISFACLILLVSLAASSQAELTAHFVDVGQGGAVFIQKEGRNYVYDCGDTFAAKTFIEYLQDLDIKTIDAVIVSHAHKDHMGACTALLKSPIKVKRIYHNGSKASTGAWRKFLKEANQTAEEVIVVDHNLELEDLTILVAFNKRERFTKEADNSLLVRFTDGSIRMLLTGDCEAVCERALIADTTNGGVRATILNVGHHGSNASSSLDFLQKVKPEIAVISAGAGNQYGHPTKPVLQRLGAVNAKIYRTDHDGSIVVRSDGSAYKIETDK
jgi:competence protein ComEC